MRTNALRGLETGPAKDGEQLRNTRVTAEIVVSAEGERQTVYRAHGREFESLSTLKAALGVAT